MKKKRIGIDCRFWGIAHAGLGRYTRELVLAIIEKNDLELSLFFRKNEWEKDKKILKSAEIISADIPHYSLKEQLKFGTIVDKENLDLIHFPHFNVPVRVKTPFIVTVHDLIKHFFKGNSVTTRSLPVYWLKHLGYRFVLRQALARSRRIIVPSYFVKDQIAVHYPGVENKITVIYEAASKKYQTRTVGENKILAKYRLNKPFIVYTGSAYPFKDIPTLLKALAYLNQSGQLKKKLKLLIACGRSVFWQRLKEKVNELELKKTVVLPGQVPDQDLLSLYREASAFVIPSLMEGFGLPGLEAMTAGCPVIAARAGSLAEVYGNGAIYFSPQDVADLVEKIQKVVSFSPSERVRQIEKGKTQVSLYDWGNTAQETLEVYKKALTNS